MMRLQLLAPLAGLTMLSLVAVACSDTVDSKPGEGGAGGEGPAPTPGDGGSGGSEVGAGGACASDGSGTVVVEVTGLPAGVAPDISLDGPDQLNATETGPLEKVSAGSYVVTGHRVFDADPRVRTVFDAFVTDSTFCLSDGGTHTLSVAYRAIPSSNKLWMPTAKDDELAGFASAALAASGTKSASVALDGPAGKAVAFDRDGNLWTLGPTSADHAIARFAAKDLGASGTRAPDLELDLPEVTCLPAFSSIAFDQDGNLWLSACGGEVHRISAADLSSSGNKTSDLVITNLVDKNALGNNEGLAFDAAGNLWIGGGTALRRFDAARLTESTADAADLELAVRDRLAGLIGNSLAFDKDGNLWATDFAANAVFKVAASKLAQTGTKTADAEVSITLGIDALLSQPAFDDGSGLWLGLDAGRIGRLSPAQLGTSSGPGKPTTPSVIIQSDSIDSLLPVALFPAPKGLPLFHSIP